MCEWHTGSQIKWKWYYFCHYLFCSTYMQLCFSSFLTFSLQEGEGNLFCWECGSGDIKEVRWIHYNEAELVWMKETSVLLAQTVWDTFDFSKGSLDIVEDHWITSSVKAFPRAVQGKFKNTNKQKVASKSHSCIRFLDALHL